MLIIYHVIFLPIDQNKGGLIWIENITKNKVLGTINDCEVILEAYEEDKAEQMWKKGIPGAEGYSTLENFKVPKIMTAISPSVLQMKGNIILS